MSNKRTFSLSKLLLLSSWSLWYRYYVYHNHSKTFPFLQDFYLLLNVICWISTSSSHMMKLIVDWLIYKFFLLRSSSWRNPWIFCASVAGPSCTPTYLHTISTKTINRLFLRYYFRFLKFLWIYYIWYLFRIREFYDSWWISK